jgi:hypothetical protein
VLSSKCLVWPDYRHDPHPRPQECISLAPPHDTSPLNAFPHAYKHQSVFDFVVVQFDSGRPWPSWKRLNNKRCFQNVSLYPTSMCARYVASAPRVVDNSINKNDDVPTGSFSACFVDPLLFPSCRNNCPIQPKTSPIPLQATPRHPRDVQRPPKYAQNTAKTFQHAPKIRPKTSSRHVRCVLFALKGIDNNICKQMLFHTCSCFACFVDPFPPTLPQHLPNTPRHAQDLPIRPSNSHDLTKTTRDAPIIPKDAPRRPKIPTTYTHYLA